MSKPSLLLLLLLPALLRAQGAERAPEPLAFIHVAIIDVGGGQVRPDSTVILDGDRISAVGASGNTAIPARARVIQAQGKYLIPGLWDMHVHLGVTGMDYRPFLLQYVAHGVTGVRDMGGVLHQGQFDLWREQMEQGELIGPRMAVATTIVDGPRPVRPLISIAAGNVAAGRMAVESLHRAGADFIKVYSLLPREAYFAIASQARKRGMAFAGHVPDSVSALEASDAGQKSIEHLTGIGLYCATNEADLRKQLIQATTGPGVDADGEWRARVRLERAALDSYDARKAAELFKRFARNHTWQCPTLTVLRSTNDKGRFARILELVGAMQGAGVEFIAGTDAPSPQCPPGSALHDELALLVQAGLTPLQALQAATFNAARYLGMARESGSIAVGKRADLVLLEADPLADIAHTRRIAAVVTRGRLIERQQIERMLADAQLLSEARK